MWRISIFAALVFFLVCVTFARKEKMPMPVKGACLRNENTGALLRVSSLAHDTLGRPIVRAEALRANLPSSEEGVEFSITETDLTNYTSASCPLPQR